MYPNLRNTKLEEYKNKREKSTKKNKRVIWQPCMLMKNNFYYYYSLFWNYLLCCMFIYDGVVANHLNK